MLGPYNAALEEDQREFEKLVKEYEKKRDILEAIFIPIGEMQMSPWAYEEATGANKEQKKPEEIVEMKTSFEVAKLRSEQKTEERSIAESNFKDAEAKLDAFFKTRPALEYAWLVGNLEKRRSLLVSPSSDVHEDWDDGLIPQAQFEKARDILNAFLHDHPEFVEPEKNRKEVLEKKLIQGKYEKLVGKYKRAYKNYITPTYQDNKLQQRANQAEKAMISFLEQHLQVLDPAEHEERQKEAAEKERIAQARQERAVQNATDAKRAHEEVLKMQSAARLNEEKKATVHEARKHEQRISDQYVTHCTQGQKDFKDGSYGKAIGEFSEAIALSEKNEQLIKGTFNDPKRAIVYINRGNAYKAQGKLKEAIIDFDKAIVISPGHMDLIDGILAKKTKKEIFEAIKGITNNEQRKALVEKCLDQNSPLGVRMSKDVSEKGMPAKIQSYLDSGCPPQQEGSWARLFRSKSKTEGEAEITSEKKSGSKLEIK